MVTFLPTAAMLLEEERNDCENDETKERSQPVLR